ncbi:MAG: nuclear transport factor 2 family protein [Minwuia sp.]|uniref:nuclear transport factor 2 family protein n=1 Tax=Minwuia sp. TaxID=2493630 RepID=UPI003A83D907
MTDNNDQITGLLARYCHIVDNEPAEIIADLFWDDATLDLGGLHEGREAIVQAYVDWIARRRVKTDQLRHMIFQPAIEIDGKRATARTYFNADGFAGPDKALLLVRGIYRDELEKRDGEWRFARREIAVLSAS